MSLEQLHPPRQIHYLARGSAGASNLQLGLHFLPPCEYTYSEDRTETSNESPLRDATLRST
jgi:hypothetical protein